MTRTLICWGWLILALAGCGESADLASVPRETARLAAPDMAPAPAEAMKAEGAAANQPRYLAERQFWTYELPEDQIEARWQAHLNLCLADCEVLYAAVSKSNQAPVTASLHLRVGRSTATRLFAAMAGPEIKERRIEREDKTLEVVDTEARLKNMADLRDRLRGLLATYKGSLKDILETERELARVQGELDALAAQRKALANETEKILLNAEYHPAPSLTETGALQPLVEAWRNGGRAFAESLASALMFLVQALPWLVIVVPALWGGWKLVRRLVNWRRQRTQAKPAHD